MNLEQLMFTWKGRHLMLTLFASTTILRPLRPRFLVILIFWTGKHVKNYCIFATDSNSEIFFYIK